MISRMLLVILFTATLVFAPAPRAEAIDPVTIAILAKNNRREKSRPVEAALERAKAKERPSK